MALNLDKTLGSAGKLSAVPQSNLVHIERKKFFRKSNIVILLFTLIILGAVGFFGIYKRYADIALNDEIIHEKTVELQNVKDKVNKQYNAVYSEYQAHTKSFLNGNAVFGELEDRVVLLNTVQMLVGDKATCSAYNISKNTVSFQVSDISLKTLSEILAFLNEKAETNEYGLLSVHTSNTTAIPGEDDKGENFVKLKMELVFANPEAYK
jgi:cell division protein FtsL